MDRFWMASTTALWLGILTSISPCPMATNIAAISFIGRRVEHPGAVAWAGLLYTLGRVLTYMLLAVLIVSGVLATPQVSHFLQKHMNQLLGPILILAGMVLLEMLPFRLPGIGADTGKLQQRVDGSGLWGAGLLGIMFALTFCPVSAALFFGSLIPLSVTEQSRWLLPALYGVGTGLPVLVFAFLLTLGVKSVGKLFHHLTRLELWARRLTGVVFILIGIYFALNYNFRIL
jgi:cytochrome c biogenesis protein CcdA